MSDRILVSGEPVPANGEHTKLKPNGQQSDYVVLTPADRAKGFVKPVRRSYKHKCGVVTTMAQSIAETYARDPHFYSGTFCVGCSAHYPLVEFAWEPDGEPMEPKAQNLWHETQAAQRMHEEKDRRQRRIAELKRELAELEAQ